MIQKDNRLLIGVSWMIAAQVFFVAVWCSIKYLGDRLPIFEIVFYRCFFSLILFVPITYFKQRTFKGVAWKNLLLRGVFGFIAMVLSFYAIIHMEMGNAASLYNTMPIFVAMFAPFLVGETFNKRQFIFILMAFVGILLVLKPDTSMFRGVAVYAVLSAVFAAFAMIFIRKSHKTDSTITIAFYFTLVGTVICAPFLFLNYLPPTLEEWLWFIFSGVMVTFAQLAVTRAYKYTDASTIAPFSYLSVIGAYVAGIIIFNEIPDKISIIGAAVIIAGGVLITMNAPATRPAVE